MKDPDIHFGYVCSDLSVNGGTFNAGNGECQLPVTMGEVPNRQTR